MTTTNTTTANTDIGMELFWIADAPIIREWIECNPGCTVEEAIRKFEVGTGLVVLQSERPLVEQIWQEESQRWDWERWGWKRPIVKEVWG